MDRLKKRYDGVSLSAKLRASYSVIILLMLIPTLISFAVSSRYSAQYDSLITNVNSAHTLNLIVKSDVSNEIWDIVAGNKEFSQGKQYEIIDEINQRLFAIRNKASTREGMEQLGVAQRAMDTLKNYVDKLGAQMQSRAPVKKNEQLLEEIRAVSALVHEVIQEFTMLEISNSAQVNESIKKSFQFTFTLEVLLFIFTCAFALYAQNTLSLSIIRPIKELEVLSTRIAQGDLKARAQAPGAVEIQKLTNNLNQMAGDIQTLLDQNIQEQKNRQKSEMQALQAQITPHFLYNTLDTIVWLAEANKNEEVITITSAFSKFFRISLSKGMDWISVENEVEHARNYLTIQKTRYRDILDYSITCEECIKDKRILKLILQPLVENALYHGIKNKRGRGTISVEGRLERTAAGERLYFCVSDDGMGITPERLEQIERLLSGEPGEEQDGGYGLYNVSKRLQLYYNMPVGLRIESEYRQGTRVSFTVPIVE